MKSRSRTWRRIRVAGLYLSAGFLASCAFRGQDGSSTEQASSSLASASASDPMATSPAVLAHEKVGQLDLNDTSMAGAPPEPPYDLSNTPSPNRDALKAASDRALAVGARFGTTAVLMEETPDGALYAVVIDDNVMAANAAALGMINVAPPSTNAENAPAADDPFVPKGWSNGVDNRIDLSSSSFDTLEFNVIGKHQDYGTGTLIGRRIVITAAHIATWGTPTNWSFTPRMKPSGAPYGTSGPFAYAFWSANWTSSCLTMYTSDCHKYDWAVDILTDPTGFTWTPGYMGFEWSTDADIASRPRRNVGYPLCPALHGHDDAPVGCPPTNSTLMPWGDIGDNCAGVTPTFWGGSTSNGWPYQDGANPDMIEACDVSDGHSGGPLYEPSGPYLMGVITSTPCGAAPPCVPSSEAARINQIFYNYLLYLRSTYP